MSTDPKHISETIGYRIARVCKAHGQRANKILSDFGLHLGQEMILQHLWHEDQLTQSDLANRVGVQIQTIHKMVRRMEKAGLLTKEADEHDGRVSRIHLTAKGREIQTVVETAWNQLEQETLIEFTLEEQYILKRLLQKLEANLSKYD